MISKKFVEICANTLLGGGASGALGLGENPALEFGVKDLPGSLSLSADETYYCWRTTGQTYFNEGTSTGAAVDCVLKGIYAKEKFTPYYSMPLQKQVTVGEGSQIKVNAYAENGGVHTRGIEVKFFIPQE